MSLSCKQNPENEPLFTAQDFLASKNIRFDIPDNIIMLPSVNFTRELSALSQKTYNLIGTIDIINDDIAVMHNFALGAPLCVIMAELAAALGAKQFILAGSAGALKPGLQAGDRIFCTGAYADEGTSRRYCGDEYIEASLKTDLNKINFKQSGSSWTTDALFMETKAAVVDYCERGCLCVDMEASALFAFAKARCLSAGACFIISDLLYGGEWQSAPKQVHTNKAIRALVEELIKIF